MSDDFSPETLLLERDGNVLWVRLHRPEARNGINMEMCAELQDTFDYIDDDPEIRCAIVTGEGKTFCTGGDLMPSGGSSSGRTAVDKPPSQMDYRRAVRPFQELFRAYWRMEARAVFRSGFHGLKALRDAGRTFDDDAGLAVRFRAAARQISPAT